MRTPIERETALIFAAALLMQDVVHNKALDRPARDKIREAALTLKEMADEIGEATECERYFFEASGRTAASGYMVTPLDGKTRRGISA